MQNESYRTYDDAFIATHLGQYHGAIGCEPDLRPDLAGLTKAKLPVVVLSLLIRGITELDAIFRYLVDHGATFTRDELLEVAERHSAIVEWDDGTADGLWAWNDRRSLRPLVFVPY